MGSGGLESPWALGLDLRATPLQPRKASDDSACMDQCAWIYVDLCAWIYVDLHSDLLNTHLRPRKASDDSACRFLSKVT